MCTVSFIPLENGFVLTSNRDERKQRTTLAPQYHNHKGHQIYFPKDQEKGGTWIACNNHSRVACLLNGGFEGHEMGKVYGKSRGQVLLDSFLYEANEAFVKNYDLKDVEPFTLILIDYKEELEIQELVWDGARKHHRLVDIKTPQLWSSSTLYDQENRANRQLWFEKWLSDHQESPDYNIAEFHARKHATDDQVDIIMQRDNGLQTVSVSSIQVQDRKLNFIYTNLLENRKVQ